jgi:hypothetical protein
MERPVSFTISIEVLRERSSPRGELAFDDVASTTGRPFRAQLHILEPRDKLTALEKSKVTAAARRSLKMLIGGGFTRDEVHGMVFTVRPL